MKRRRSRKMGFGNAMTMRSFGVSDFMVYSLWFVVWGSQWNAWDCWDCFYFLFYFLFFLFLSNEVLCVLSCLRIFLFVVE
jgi:Ca2+/Na+ antiporter